MTKQEQAAVKLQQAQSALARTELEGKLIAAEAALEKAEKASAEAKDQPTRDSANAELATAKAVRRACVEAIIEHDASQEKEAQINLVLNGGSPSRGSYIGRVADGFRSLVTAVF